MGLHWIALLKFLDRSNPEGKQNNVMKLNPSANTEF